MTDNRRNFIKKLLTVGGYFAATAAGFLNPLFARAEWPAPFFARGDLDSSLKQLLGDNLPIKSDKIKLKIPRIAENGSLVPVTVTSSLDNVESIAILVAKNPVPLVARFTLSPDLDAMVSARIKMAETSDVIALVKSGDQYFSARQMVKVTIGGCGG